MKNLIAAVARLLTKKSSAEQVAYRAAVHARLEVLLRWPSRTTAHHARHWRGDGAVFRAKRNR